MIRKVTFAQDSHVEIDFEYSHKRTILKDVYTTPPFRVMRPFYDKDGFCEVMVMNSGPGILEGDRQIERYSLKPNTKVEITTQSYEKVHQMLRGDYATRNSQIDVDDNSIFIFKMLPMIIYKNANFIQNIGVNLAEKGKAIISNCIVAGRTGSGERFEFTKYQSKLDVFLEKELIYTENNLITPENYNLLELGFFEGYDHILSLAVFNFGNTNENREKILEIIDKHSKKRDLLGGVSETFRGDLQIRILGRIGQDLLECSDEIIEMLKI